MTAKVRRFILGTIVSLGLLVALLMPQLTNTTTILPFNLDGLKISPCYPGGGSGGGRPSGNGKLVKIIHTDTL